MSWNFLEKHRMFRAVVSSTPRGYQVELVVHDECWGRAEARTVKAAMKEASDRADEKLQGAHAALKKAARGRIRSRCT